MEERFVDASNFAGFVLIGGLWFFTFFLGMLWNKMTGKKTGEYWK